MKTAKIFNSGGSQAVRLPREFRVKSSEVRIAKVGDSIMLTPIDNSWENLIKSLGEFTPDFLETRDQLPAEKREGLFK